LVQPCYGSNPAALRDVLTGMLEGPVHLRWTHVKLSRERLPNIERLRERLEWAAQERPGLASEISFDEP
jgi:RNAse (barnase) inhibitor barstar